jgi:hypothetical protein
MVASTCKTYAVRMAAVFMMSLAAIWLKTGLMPRWLVGVSYLVTRPHPSWPPASLKTDSQPTNPAT